MDVIFLLNWEEIENIEGKKEKLIKEMKMWLNLYKKTIISN